MRKILQRYELQDFASDTLNSITKSVSAATIIALSGELGAGKTTFVQELARALGIDGNITSPTFVIEKIYKSPHPKFSKLVHIDAYRLKDKSELFHLGWSDIASNPDTIICIEWPENIDGAITPDGNITNIRFDVVDENSRSVTVII